MPIITFWSEKKKESAQTLSMIAIATHMAVEHNYKVLIIDTYLDSKVISDCYWDSKASNTVRKAVQQLNAGKMDLGAGLSGVAQLVKSGKETPEAIKDYTKVIYKNRLEVLTGGKLSEQDRLEESFKDIINVASRYYDYIFVDLRKGLDKPYIQEILDISTVIVVNLTQRLAALDEYRELVENNKLFKSNKTLPLIGRYDRFSKYNKKNISRNYLGMKEDVSVVPYNTLYFEATGEGGVAEYFLKFRKELMRSDDRNIEFVTDVATSTSDIINRVKALQMGF